MANETEMVVDTRTSSEACANLTDRAVDGLTVGGSFILVSDHDPIALHYMLDAERPGAIGWESLEQGPEVWRTRISKVAAAE